MHNVAVPEKFVDVSVLAFPAWRNLLCCTIDWIYIIFGVKCHAFIVTSTYEVFVGFVLVLCVDTTVVSPSLLATYFMLGKRGMAFSRFVD